MKKAIIILLLICIILGCFAFTACNNKSDDVPKNAFWKVENSPIDHDCYAFFYTGEYKKFFIRYSYIFNGAEESEIIYDEYLLVETLTYNRDSNNHSHSIKPNTIAYVPIRTGLNNYYPATKLEYVAYDRYSNGNYVNERVIFSTLF